MAPSVWRKTNLHTDSGNKGRTWRPGRRDLGAALLQPPRVEVGRGEAIGWLFHPRAQLGEAMDQQKGFSGRKDQLCPA